MQTNNFVCLQTEADLVQQSLKTQHCCRGVWLCSTSLPAGLGSNLSTFRRCARLVCSTYSKLERRRLTAVTIHRSTAQSRLLRKGVMAAAARLRLERGKLVTVRSFVAAESQERTEGHHRK